LGYIVELTECRRKNAADEEFYRAMKEHGQGERPGLPDVVCLITGDSDFLPVLQYLQSQRAQVLLLNYSRKITAQVLLGRLRERSDTDRFLAFQKLFREIHPKNKRRYR